MEYSDTGRSSSMDDEFKLYGKNMKFMDERLAMWNFQLDLGEGLKYFVVQAVC